MSYFSKVSYGDILSRITNDVVLCSRPWPTACLHDQRSGPILGCLVMMFGTEWRMALAAIAVTAPLGFLIMAAVMLRSQKYFTARQENLSTLNGYIEEMCSATTWCASRANEQVKETFGGDECRSVRRRVAQPVLPASCSP